MFTTTANIMSGNNANIFQNLSQLQLQQQQQQQTSQSIATNVLTSPPSIQIQRATIQQQQTQQQAFNRRTPGGLLRNAGATQQLRFHQPGGEAGNAGGGLIQIHPNSSQTGGPNIIQIHQGQILKSTNAATSSAGIIGTQTDVRGGTISPGKKLGLLQKLSWFSNVSF